MVSFWEDPKRIKNLRSPAVTSGVSFGFGIIFAVLGVIGDAANVKLGLEPTSWFLLAIVGFVVSVGGLIRWEAAWYLRSIEAEGKKKG